MVDKKETTAIVDAAKAIEGAARRLALLEARTVNARLELDAAIHEQRFLLGLAEPKEA